VGVFSWLTETRLNAWSSLRQSQRCALRRGGRSSGPPDGKSDRVESPGSGTDRSEGRSNGGFVKFGDLGLRGCRLDGVWHPGGLWNPSRGVCADAPAGPVCGSEGAGGSGAGAVKEFSVVSDQFSVRSLNCAGADRIGFQSQLPLDGNWVWISKHRLLALMDNSMQEKVSIYVRLLKEGTEVFRPTQALDLGNGIYRLEATPGYDPEDEICEFVPGSDVRGEVRSFESGQRLVAMRASRP